MKNCVVIVVVPRKINEVIHGDRSRVVGQFDGDIARRRREDCGVLFILIELHRWPWQGSRRRRNRRDGFSRGVGHGRCGFCSFTGHVHTYENEQHEEAAHDGNAFHGNFDSTVTIYYDARAMYPLIAIVGPSGAGKTTLILRTLERLSGRLAIVRSITTRPPRESQDGLFYELIPRKEFERRIANGRVLQSIEYAGNLYGNDREEVQRVLSEKIGIAALVEQSISNFREAGYRVIVVRIIPHGHTPRERGGRAAADAARLKLNLSTDHTIVNSFEPGGLDKATAELAASIERYATTP